MLAAAQGMGGGGGAPQQVRACFRFCVAIPQSLRVLACALTIRHRDPERAIDQYTWNLLRHFLSRDQLAGELQLPQAGFAPAG